MKRITIVLICLMLLTMFSFVLPSQASQVKLLAITFDDGPSKYTAQLLDGLKERNAKATFFMVGGNVSAFPDTVKRMKQEGHQIATHTMTHANLAKLGTAAIQREVFGVNERLNAILGEGKYYLRPPYGSYNQTVKQAVQTPLVYWSVDTQDWKYRQADNVRRVIVNQAKDGDIILLHDLYKTSVDGALSAIDDLRKEGYVFVTVEQLLKRRGITPEDGVVYFDAPNKGINLPAVSAPIITTATTVLGTKVMIGKNDADNRIFYTNNGGNPSSKDSVYSHAYYINEEQSIKAIAVAQDEISDMMEYSAKPLEISKSELDKGYYRYRIEFLHKKIQFKIGMKL